MDQFRFLPQSDGTVELDVFPSFLRVGERGRRPRMPYMLLMCAAETGMILDCELLTVEGDIETLWVQLPPRLLSSCLRHRLRPAAVVVRLTWIPMILDGFCKALDLPLEVSTHLPAIAQAREEILRRFAELR